jgi:hypothetical protein
MTDLITRLRADADVWDSQRISVSHYTASLEREAAAEIERLTRERDEWARKWHRIRGELAEIKWPGMKGVIRPKRAYYETHEPPHCPTCGCGSEAPNTPAP